MHRNPRFWAIYPPYSDHKGINPMPNKFPDTGDLIMSDNVISFVQRESRAPFVSASVLRSHVDPHRGQVDNPRHRVNYRVRRIYQC
jgi:hypothetical protein